MPVWWALLIAGSLALLSIAGLPVIDADALYYGKAAKNILATGDWLALGRPAYSVDVPPLTIWFMAASLRLGGDTPAALRLWHIAMTLALVAVTYLLARAAAEREGAILAALFLLTNQQVLSWSLAPKQDLPLTLFLSLALLAYLRFRRDAGTWAAVGAGLCLGLAVLTKGIAAIPAFGVIVAADLMLCWRLGAPGRWRWPQAIAGAAVFLAVAAPWFAYGVVREGQSFVRLYLLQDSTAWRFFRYYGVPLPYWAALLAYVPLVIVGVFPWSGVLPGAIRETCRAAHSRAHPLRLCAVWVLAVFVVLSVVPGTKSIRYLLPLYPPLSVLAARSLAPRLDTRRGLWTASGILAAMWVLPVAAVMGFGSGTVRSDLKVFLPVIAAFSLVVAAAVFAALRGQGRVAIALLAGGMILAHAAYEWTSTAEFERRWPWRTVALQIDRRYRSEDRVVMVGEESQESKHVNYFLTATTIDVTDEDTLKQSWSRTGVIAVLAPTAYRRIQRELRPSVVMALPTGWVLVTNRQTAP
ncbi:MAG TPA: glycosyltransferase family 39 protein [bacterium]